jgi:hypothetical protein
VSMSNIKRLVENVIPIAESFGLDQENDAIMFALVDAYLAGMDHAYNTGRNDQ